MAPDDDLNSERFGARPNDFDVLRMTGFRDKKGIPRFVPLEPVAHHHGFRASRGFVEHRGVGDVKRSQVRDHRLKIQQRLEPALGNLGLIRRVLRVPAGILEHVALNHRRRDAVVVSHPDIRAAHLVLRGNGPERGERFVFAPGGGKLERPIQPDCRRNRFVDQLVEPRKADPIEHRPGLLRARTDVAAGKLIRMRRQSFSREGIARDNRRRPFR